MIIKTTNHDERMNVRRLIGRFGDTQEVYSDHSMDFEPQSETCFVEVQKILNTNKISFERV